MVSPAGGGLFQLFQLVSGGVCHNTHRISLCCVWGQSQSAHTDPCPPSKDPTMDTWASELDLGVMDEDRLVQCVQLSFTSGGEVIDQDALQEEDKPVEGV